MKLFLTTSILLLLLVTTGNGADYWFYNLDSTQIVMSEFADRVAAKITPDQGPAAVELALQYDFLVDDIDIPLVQDGFVQFEIEPGYSLADVIWSLNLDDDILMVNPVAKDAINQPVYLGNSLIVNYYPTWTNAQIDSLNSEMGLSVRQILDDSLRIYLLEKTEKSWQDITAIARAYFLTGSCFAAQPNRGFQPIRASNDTFFGEQWHLLNSGQQGGTPGADIEWELSNQFHQSNFETINGSH